MELEALHLCRGMGAASDGRTVRADSNTERQALYLLSACAAASVLVDIGNFDRRLTLWVKIDSASTLANSLALVKVKPTNRRLYPVYCTYISEILATLFFAMTNWIKRRVYLQVRYIRGCPFNIS